MFSQTNRAPLILLEALMLLMVEKGLIEREDIVEALEAAAAGLDQYPGESDSAAAGRIANSVRRARIPERATVISQPIDLATARARKASARS